MVNRVVVLLDCKGNHHRGIPDMVRLALNLSFLHVFERQEWSYCVTARWNQWKAGEFWLRRATTSGQWAALLVLTADCVVTLLQAKVLFIYKDGKCCFAKVLSVWAAVGCHLAGPSGWRWLPTADQASACCGKATSSEWQVPGGSARVKWKLQWMSWSQTGAAILHGSHNTAGML